MLLAGGSLSCCIDPHRGRNMCAMHRSMGRLKMRVHLPDDWGKLCRWHWQHSEGHTDLRRSPRGEARPLVALMGGCLITCPPETPDSLPGTHLLSRAMSAGGGYPVLGLFWGQGAGVSPTTVPQGSVTEGCSTCEGGVGSAVQTLHHQLVKSRQEAGRDQHLLAEVLCIGSRQTSVPCGSCLKVNPSPRD